METRRVPPDISDRVLFYHGITAFLTLFVIFFLLISNKKCHITSYIWTKPLIFLTSYVINLVKLYNIRGSFKNPTGMTRVKCLPKDTSVYNRVSNPGRPDSMSSMLSATLSRLLYITTHIRIQFSRIVLQLVLLLNIKLIM